MVCIDVIAREPFSMTRRLRLAFAAALFGGLPSSALADDYAAISNTAMSITGDIAFDDFSITFANGKSLEFAELVADHFTVDGEDRPASVYRVAKPADPKLQNGNRLCGSGPVTYVAAWGIDGDDLATVVAVFTGEDEPQASDEMCASYTYEIVQ